MSAGHHYQVVISASHALADRDPERILDRVRRDLEGVWPAAAGAAAAAPSGDYAAGGRVLALRRARPAPPAASNAGAEPLSGRRLDGDGLAGHDGGRGPQRPAGGRGVAPVAGASGAAVGAGPAARSAGTVVVRRRRTLIVGQAFLPANWQARMPAPLINSCPGQLIDRQDDAL